MTKKEMNTRLADLMAQHNDLGWLIHYGYNGELFQQFLYQTSRAYHHYNEFIQQNPLLQNVHLYAWMIAPHQLANPPHDQRLWLEFFKGDWYFKYKRITRDPIFTSNPVMVNFTGLKYLEALQFKDLPYVRGVWKIHVPDFQLPNSSLMPIWNITIWTP